MSSKDIIIIIIIYNNIKFLIVLGMDLGDAKKKQGRPDSHPFQRSQKQAYFLRGSKNSQISTKTYLATETGSRESWIS